LPYQQEPSTLQQQQQRISAAAAAAAAAGGGSQASLSKATYDVMQWLMAQNLVTLTVTQPGDTGDTGGTSSSRRRRAGPLGPHAQLPPPVVSPGVGSPGVTAGAASRHLPTNLPSLQQLLHHFSEPGRDVRDLLFQVAEPRGWPWEAPDPPGLRAQLFR
jgi:hypothetical protein